MSNVQAEELVEYEAIPLGKTIPLKREARDGRVQLHAPVEDRPPYDTILVLTPPALGR